MNDSPDHEIAAASAPDAHPDRSMIRSEEHLQVTTDIVPVGRVRLRKYLVTEEQTFTVPVTREEIAIDYEDVPAHEQIPDPNARLAADTYEVVRYEERVVITTQRVAVERVRLVRRVLTIDHTVTGQVRHELVDVEQDAGPAGEQAVDPARADDATAPGRR